jgi:hypothetical protein
MARLIALAPESVLEAWVREERQRKKNRTRDLDATEPAFSPESDGRLLDWLLCVWRERERLGPVALADEPHERTLWRECLRATEASLRCLWVVRLGWLLDENESHDTGDASAEDGMAAAGALAAGLRGQARWQAQQALYLLNEYRRHAGAAG